VPYNHNIRGSWGRAWQTGVAKCLIKQTGLLPSEWPAVTVFVQDFCLSSSICCNCVSYNVDILHAGVWTQVVLVMHWNGLYRTLYPNLNSNPRPFVCYHNSPTVRFIIKCDHVECCWQVSLRSLTVPSFVDRCFCLLFQSTFTESLASVDSQLTNLQILIQVTDWQVYSHPGNSSFILDWLTLVMSFR